MPQLAVPVSPDKLAFKTNLITKDPTAKHTGLPIVFAFYYLLQVGEYTKPHTVLKVVKRVSVTHTKQFIVSYVGFSRMERKHPIIPQ